MEPHSRRHIVMAGLVPAVRDPAVRDPAIRDPAIRGWPIPQGKTVVYDPHKGGHHGDVAARVPTRRLRA